jgi:ArsR family transcriptional regulator
MIDSTKIFKALSDSNRLRILKALQTKVLCVCEIKELVKLANSTVSQHLKILKEAGFIEESKDGKWINYGITANPTDSRINTILVQLDFWINDEKQIISDKKIISKLNRNKLCKT